MEPREIRRKDRALNRDDCLEILSRGEYGVLATSGPDGQPYAVPISYTFKNETIYFHCARDGHKIENLKRNPRVCFTVTDGVQAVYDKGFSTYYESVIAFGQAREVTDDAEKNIVLHDLAAKYLPDHMDKADADIQHSWSRTAVYAVGIEALTGKSKRRK